jgi:hypothetical protein
MFPVVTFIVPVVAFYVPVEAELSPDGETFTRMCMHPPIVASLSRNLADVAITVGTVSSSCLIIGWVIWVDGTVFTRMGQQEQTDDPDHHHFFFFLVLVLIRSYYRIR